MVSVDCQLDRTEAHVEERASVRVVASDWPVCVPAGGLS